MIDKINQFLGTVLPYIRDRMTDAGGFQLPMGWSEMPYTAKKEAIFALRRRANQQQQTRVGNPGYDAMGQARARQMLALADFLEASIVNTAPDPTRRATNAGGDEYMDAEIVDDYGDEELTPEEEAEFEREWEEFERFRAMKNRYRGR